MRIKIIVCIFFSGFLLSNNCYSAQKTWTGAVNSIWSTAGNWNPNGAPASNDTVTIQSGVSIYPTLLGDTAVGRLTISGGSINLGGFALTTSIRVLCSGGTISNGTLIVRGSVADLDGTIFNCKLDVITGQVKLDGSVFSDSCYFEQTGLGNSTGQGGNVFNGPVTLKNSGASYYIYTATAAPDTFNAPVRIYNSSGHGIVFSNSNNTVFNNNVEVNNSSNGQVTFGVNTSGITTLASGKTISVGNVGFGSGSLILNKFYQLGSTNQVINLTGTSTIINIISSQFAGNLTVSSPSILSKASTFQGNVIFTKIGTATNHCEGNNTFYADLTINNNASNTAVLRMAAQSGDFYYGSLYLNTTTGFIQMAYSDTTELSGNCTINSIKVLFNSGTGFLQLAGNREQEFSGTAGYAIEKLLINKTDSTAIFSQVVTIDSSIAFLNGIIQTDSINLLVLKSTAACSGGSASSFVHGPLKKIGNTTFTFPIGRDTSYMPLSISAPSLSTDVFTAEYFNSSQSLGNSSDVNIKYIDQCKYWSLQRTSGTSNVSVNLHWNASGCSLEDTFSLRIINWNGSSWKDLGNGGISGNLTTGSIINSGAILQYGRFTLGYTTCKISSYVTETGNVATVYVNKGIAPFTYLWSTGATTASVSNLNPGTNYFVTATDAKGCTTTSFFQRPVLREESIYERFPEHEDSFLHFQSLTNGQALSAFVEKFNITTCEFENVCHVFDVTNVITLAMNLDPDTAEYRCSTAFDFSVPILITYKDSDCVEHNIIETLSISYDPTVTGSYPYKSIYTFSGGLDVTVTILSNVSPVTCYGSNDVWFSLYNEIFIARQFCLDCEFATSIDLEYQANTDDLNISWVAIPGAVEYDLEWTFYNSNSVQANTTFNNQDHSMFSNNASRMVIRESPQSIDLVYPSGKIYCRIRGANYNADGIRQVTEWSQIELYQILTGHQDNLNWDIVRVMAEDGKRIPTINYYDGTLRNRQQQVKSSQLGETIIQETIYDYTGRPALKTLPVPSGESKIGFINRFNRNANDLEYSKEDFDEGDCSQLPATMNGTSIGSANYYSSQNPNKVAQQAYLPDSEGYPFSITEFTPDKTGRIRRQSGTGPELTLGSGHETKYYYGKPSQPELDRLFGNDVGFANHYFKEMVLDANSQVSVSYKDAHGRVIATALAGSSPASLIALPNTPPAEILNVQLNETQSFKSPEITSVHTFLVSSPDTHVVYYNLLNEVLALESCSSYCYDCYYDVEITVSDNCGNTFYNGSPYIHTATNVTLSLPDTSCSTAPDSITDNFSLFLPIGEYTITKVTTINQTSFDYYKDFYLEHALCLDYEHFLNEEINKIDFSGCNLTCEQCSTELGTQTAFVTAYLADLATKYGITTITTELEESAEEMYQMLSEQCAQLCDETTATCDNYEQQMLNDVSMGGQYNPYVIEASGQIMVPADSFSVLTQDYSGITFLDQSGQPATVLINLIPTPVNQLTPSQILEHWDPAWATSLLPLHPEHCHLTFCNNHSEANEAKQLMIATETYAEAVSAGYLCPVGTSYCPGIAIAYSDPLYTNSPFSGYLTLVRNRLNNYYEIDNTSLPCSLMYTAWEIAILTAIKGKEAIPSCTKANIPAFSSLCEADQNFAWQIFRGIYLGIRDSIYSLALRSNCTNSYIGGSLPHFMQLGHASDPNYLYFQYHSPRFPIGVAQPASQSAANTIASSSLTVISEETCSSYASAWWDALKHCVNLADSATLIDGMIEVCIAGFDIQHPFGSSSTPPGITTTNGYTNFNDVLSGLVTVTTECNTDLISMPYPYGANQVLDNEVIYDSIPPCLCQQLTTLIDDIKIEFGDTADVWTHINNLYQTSFTESDIAFISEYCDSTEILTCNRLHMPMKMPYALSCLECLDCDELRNYYGAFGVLYPQADKSEYYTHLLTNYLNHETGFNLAYSDYINALENCAIVSSLNCDTLEYLLDEYRNTNPALPFALWVGQQLSTLITFDEVNALFAPCSLGTYPSTPAIHQVDVWDAILYYMQFANSILVNDTTLLNFLRNNYWPSMTNSQINDYLGQKGVLSEIADTCSKLSDWVSLWQRQGAFEAGNLATWIVQTKPTTLSVTQVYNFLLYCNLLGEFDENCDILKLYYDQFKFYKIDSDSSFIDYCNARIDEDYTEEVYDIWFRSCEITPGDLCNKPFFPEMVIDSFPCVTQLMELAASNAWHAYNLYVDSITNVFDTAYINRCMRIRETFYMEAPINEYHYTLYYYDQSNNLVKTVPPAGVALLSAPLQIAAGLHRENNLNPPAYPTHSLITRYYYNSLNQVTKQFTPDGDTTVFMYDQLGRVIASQNRKQKQFSNYSYSIYDPLGRISETGLITPGYALTQLLAYQPNLFNTWLGSGTKEQVTHTYYDTPEFSLDLFSQDNTRQRIASVTYEEIDDNDINTYLTASHYSYDIAGNVKSILQENRHLESITKHRKRIDYSFDLISGKVNKVWYQRDSIDQFIHKYKYDADNKLELVSISQDGYVWYQEAQYFYYDHGPLARIELGEYGVQGIDYAYTIQGWLKAINSSQRNYAYDMGRDGNLLGLANEDIARDAFAYSIGYFAGDYQPIGGGNDPEAIYAGTTFESASEDLFNGNIRHTTAAIRDVSNTLSSSDENMGYAYKYDQLNRIKSMQAFAHFTPSTNSWNTSGAPLGLFDEEVTYDPNGNILTYDRRGNLAATPDMDDLTYHYYPASNKLAYVEDNVAAGSYSTDLDDQFVNNYRYDSIGNLIKDSVERLVYTWKNNGKLGTVTKLSTDWITPEWDLTFTYDPMGNRVEKTHTIYETSEPAPIVKSTFYVRDATGNSLATYEWNNQDELILKEHVMYGSTRLGAYNADSLQYSLSDGPTEQLPPPYPNFLGRKQFELTNHLGNVLATISDQRIATDITSDGESDYYETALLSAQDYYPFGMLMPGRTSSSEDYRYGFNGQEKTDEIAGAGNHTTAEFWEYDTRLGRRWNVDPKPIPAISNYAVFVNNPILYSDSKGDSIGVPKNLFNSKMAGSEGYDNNGMNLNDWNDYSKGIFDVTGISLCTPTSDDGSLQVESIDENVGSSTARGLYKKALNDKDRIQTEFVFSDPNVDGAGWFGMMQSVNGEKIGWDMKSSILKIDMSDIRSIKYKNIDPRAFGIGLIVAHEITHRYLLFDDVTLKNPRGSTVDYINRCQAEMRLGLRLTYSPLSNDESPGNYILRFGEILSDGKTITTGAAFLPFK